MFTCRRVYVLKQMRRFLKESTHRIPIRKTLSYTQRATELLSEN